jgi:polar amino acid transport system ATP-binding protein/sulfate transport system ATP-binding protein
MSQSSVGEVLLAVKEVSLNLGGNQILKNVSFEVLDRIRPGVCTGQVVALLGPSGVGKTRLIRIIAGLDPPDSGAVLGMKSTPVAAGSVGVVFQDYPLLRHRTVENNLIIAGTMKGLKYVDAERRARELLGKFRLADRAAFYPAQLSGGQRQRVAIAQQLVVPKHLLLMDEPFSGLDPAALDEVIQLLVEVANLDELNTILIVTHDIHSALVISDTVFMLGRDHDPDGKLVAGARIQTTHDLVAKELAWRKDVEDDPRFVALEREVRAQFKSL